MTIEVADIKRATRDLRVGGSYRRQLSCAADPPEPSDFVHGGLYFMLWYPDQQNQADQSGLFLVPDSVVFVGKNVDSDEERDTWYFQDTKSFCAFGAYPNNRTEGLEPDNYYGRLYALNQEDLCQIADCQGLIDVLSKCIARRKSSGNSV